MLQFSKIAGRYAIERALYTRGATRAYLARDEHAGEAEVVIELAQEEPRAELPGGDGDEGGLVVGGSGEAGSGPSGEVVATLAALEHPNLSTIDRFVVDAPYHGVVKPWEAGQLLPEWLASPAGATAGRSVKATLCRDILEGLAALHGMGVLLRGLEPRGIWVVDGPRRPVARIDDFSSAVMAVDTAPSPGPGSAGPFSGGLFSRGPFSRGAFSQGIDSPVRRAPEVSRTGAHSTHSDVFAAGLILFELLAEPSTRTFGRDPSLVPLPADILGQGRPTAEQVRALVLPPYTEVVVRATQALRVERFEDGLDLLAAFDAMDLQNRARGLGLD